MRSLLKTRKSELLQERDERMVEQERLRTECDEKSSRYRNVLSTVRRLVFDTTSSEGRLEELVSRLRLLYGEGRKVSVPAGPLLQVV